MRNHIGALFLLVLIVSSQSLAASRISSRFARVFLSRALVSSRHFVPLAVIPGVAAVAYAKNHAINNPTKALGIPLDVPTREIIRALHDRPNGILHTDLPSLLDRINREKDWAAQRELLKLIAKSPHLVYLTADLAEYVTINEQALWEVVRWELLSIISNTIFEDQSIKLKPIITERIREMAIFALRERRSLEGNLTYYTNEIRLDQRRVLCNDAEVYLAGLRQDINPSGNGFDRARFIDLLAINTHRGQMLNNWAQFCLKHHSRMEVEIVKEFLSLIRDNASTANPGLALETKQKIDMLFEKYL